MLGKEINNICHQHPLLCATLSCMWIWKHAHRERGRIQTGKEWVQRCISGYRTFRTTNMQLIYFHRRHSLLLYSNLTQCFYVAFKETNFNPWKAHLKSNFQSSHAKQAHSPRQKKIKKRKLNPLTKIPWHLWRESS